MHPWEDFAGGLDARSHIVDALAMIAEFGNRNSPRARQSRTRDYLPRLSFAQAWFGKGVGNMISVNAEIRSIC